MELPDLYRRRNNARGMYRVIKYSMAIAQDLLPREGPAWKTLLPGGVQYDYSPAEKNILNKFRIQSPRRARQREKWRKKREPIHRSVEQRGRRDGKKKKWEELNEKG